MKPTRVLVIEDQDYLREILVAVLEASGYPALGMAAATEALRRLPALSPELILLDMSMPGMDGEEFLAHLRANPRWAELPVVVLSGFGETLSRLAGEPNVDVLAKPIDAGTLIERTRQIIGPTTDEEPATQR